jgi:hypothetical protein
MRTDRHALRKMRGYLAIMICVGGTSIANVALAQSANYNGTYAGLQTLTENVAFPNYSKCLRGPFKRKLVVTDGTITYAYNPKYHREVTGTVSVDGDVSAYLPTPDGGVKLAGKIQGDDFTGEVWSVLCTYSLELRRNQ